MMTRTRTKDVKLLWGGPSRTCGLSVGEIAEELRTIRNTMRTPRTLVYASGLPGGVPVHRDTTDEALVRRAILINREACK
jgi:hypothetical protein